MRPMSKILLSRSIPPEPSDYQFLISIDYITTWKAPSSGWYQITVIGRGGNGGQGGSGYPYQGATNANGGNGGGGGGGGCAISRLYIKKGTEVPIVAGSVDVVYFNAKDNTIAASGGTNGGKGKDNTSGYGSNQANLIGAAGIGGTAYGGNRLNRIGNNGNYWYTPYRWGNGSAPLNGQKYYSTPYAQGGLDGGQYPTYQPTAGASAPRGNVNSPMFGGGGGGGGGGASYAVPNEGAHGGTGAKGGVVIEIGVK